jgi:hypothetical protein
MSSPKSKSKAIPVIGHADLLGCETLRIQHFLDDQFTDGSRLTALCAGHALPPRKNPSTHFC